MVFVSRLLPFVRAIFPYAAGVAEMSFLRVRLVRDARLDRVDRRAGVLGRAVGSNWQHWRHNLEYVDYAAVALLVAAIVYLIVRRVRGGSGGPPPR